jgi:hypothetical protein
VTIAPMRKAEMTSAAQRRRRRLEALGDEKAADREEDEDADQSQLALPAAEQHQRLVALRPFGDEKRMREDHRAGGEEAQRVEIILPRHRPGFSPAASSSPPRT